MVIVPDRVSDILTKGEYQPRYYNPGDLFNEVHLLLCNDDKPDLAALQATVGQAKLHVHNLPEDSRYFIEHRRIFKLWHLFGVGLLWDLLVLYQFYLLDHWVKPAIDLAKQIQPAMIRCHGNDYNAYVASRIKQALGIPYVVSLHINPDANQRRRVLDPGASGPQRLFSALFDEIEKEGLLHADKVLPVYQSIIPYLKRVNCTNYEVAYNVLSEHLQKKENYSLHRPVRLISVGRHFQLKNPSNIILALKELPEAQLTLVGDGPLQNELVSLVKAAGLAERVVFLPSVLNLELCQMLPEYDIFVIHTEHWELSKSLLEALLTGLPAVVNHREGGDAPELDDRLVLFADNSPRGYKVALKSLIDNHDQRELLGRYAYDYAQMHWAPQKSELNYVNVYKRIMLGDKP
jgi:glycosyltransferase involved in cell wall biosynthesis